MCNCVKFAEYRFSPEFGNSTKSGNAKILRLRIFFQYLKAFLYCTFILEQNENEKKVEMRNLPIYPEFGKPKF